MSALIIVSGVLWNLRSEVARACHPGRAVGLHANSINRRSWLGILRRAAGHIRFVGRTDNKARTTRVSRLKCAQMRQSRPCTLVAGGLVALAALSVARAQSANPVCQRLEAQLTSLDRGNADPARAEQIRRSE